MTKRVVIFLCAFIGVILVLANLPVSYNDLTTKYGDNVVMLTGSRDLSSGGTGFVFQIPGGNRVIITNAHVCAVANKNMIYATTNTGQTYATRTLFRDRARDLCAVRLPHSLRQPGLNPAFDVVPEQALYIIGYPLLQTRRVVTGHLLKEEYVTVGYPIESTQDTEDCKASNGQIVDAFFYQLCIAEFEAISTEAQIYPGNSGSPVLNTSGDVIGVVFAGSSATGYAIPLQSLIEFLDEFKISQNGKYPSK